MNEAFSILGNPSKKATYDYKLRTSRNGLSELHYNEQPKLAEEILYTLKKSNCIYNASVFATKYGLQVKLFCDGEAPVPENLWDSSINALSFLGAGYPNLRQEKHAIILSFEIDQRTPDTFIQFIDKFIEGLLYKPTEAPALSYTSPKLLIRGLPKNEWNKNLVRHQDLDKIEDIDAGIRHEPSGQKPHQFFISQNLLALGYMEPLIKSACQYGRRSDKETIAYKQLQEFLAESFQHSIPWKIIAIGEGKNIIKLAAFDARKLPVPEGFTAIPKDALLEYYKQALSYIVGDIGKSVVTSINPADGTSKQNSPILAIRNKKYFESLKSSGVIPEFIVEQVHFGKHVTQESDKPPKRKRGYQRGEE